MSVQLRPDVSLRPGTVELNGMRLGLLGRLSSRRGVQILATHGMPNGRVENHVTPASTVLAYTPRMPADAIISRGHLPFRFVGALGLLAAGQPYILRGGGPFTCSHCVFAPRFLAGLSETENGLRINELNLVAPIESDRLTHLGQAMFREATEPGFGGSLIAEALAMAIVVEIARLDGAGNAGEATNRPELASWQIRLVESRIRERISEDLTLNELALSIGMSVRRLSQSVAKAKGVSLHRWIAEIRLAEARRLLIETNLPIQDIARRVSFRSAAAFSSAFRAACGLAPREFRRLAANSS